MAFGEAKSAPEEKELQMRVHFFEGAALFSVRMAVSVEKTDVPTWPAS